MSYCRPHDAMKIRATCSNLKKEADAFLYKTSLEKLKSSSVIFHREFYSDNYGYISIRQECDGPNYLKNKAEAIEFALEKLPLSQKEKTQATNELSNNGKSSRSYYDPNKKGGYEYWRRRFDMKSNLANKEVLHQWNEFYLKLKEWQGDYLSFTDHDPEEKRETLEPVHSMKRILFGLYVGRNYFGKGEQQGNNILTRIQHEESKRPFETTSDEYYILLSSGPPRAEQKFVLEMKTDTLHETYYDDYDEDY